MVDPILSTFLQLVFQNLASPIIEEFGLLWGVDGELKKLMRTLTRIRAVLSDAEERQIREEAVKIWLRELKEVAYDVDDVIDEFAFHVMKSEHEGGIRASKLQVCNFLSCFTSNQVLFRHELAHKIKKIRERLDEIARERAELHLQEGDGGRRLETGGRPQTSSFMDASTIFGRENDTEKIVELLLSNDSSRRDASVIPIVGMGGLGKTTLAQLVYNDERILMHFELRVWVCVSVDFDVRRLAKAIIESATGCNCNLLDIDPMQRRLEEILSGKRYLLVLDDVWNEDPDNWDVLRLPLRFGAEGSKIIVTTRSERVSSVMSTIPAHRLEGLSFEDCWSLFKQRAFAEESSDAHPNLVAIGRKIVEKCKGLPLAAKTLAGLLYSKTDQNVWDIILESEIWDFPEDRNGILPALRLSYHHLPAHLKRCFVYCSIFPKDYEFEKDKLIMLWMAEGFIMPKGRKHMEDIGSEYFDDLLLRSFFQYSQSDSDNQLKYKMHDLVHDLAESTAGYECFRMEDKKSCNISEKSRHAALLHENIDPMIFEAFYKSKNLRTLLLLSENENHIEKVPHDLFLKLRCIRVLDLSHTQIMELPNSIGNLKHLRYLDLSRTCIKRFPESTSSLYNLQTLKLIACSNLQELPSGMRNLINLRHLDINRCSQLISTPQEIGKLAHLQTLPRFIVDRESGHGIEQLKDLVNLRGSLLILKLENVVSIDVEKETYLTNKKYLDRLNLVWSDGVTLGDRVEEKVLESLKPHSNLKELRIKYYGGTRFPNWLGDPLFLNLAVVRLSYCKLCTLLPPLGQLPFLKSLYLYGMEGVKRVGREFCGSAVAKGFPLLESLIFSEMPDLEEWSGVNEGEFPCLHELTISDCPKLTALPQFPSLGNLELDGCDEMILKSLCYFTSLSSLTISNFPKLTWLPEKLLHPLTKLKELEIILCDELVSLSKEGLQRLAALERLVIWGCSQLTHLPDKGLPAMLKHCQISSCDNLMVLPKGMKNLSCLQSLEIEKCPQLTCLPKEGLPTTLRHLCIVDCPLLEEWYRKREKRRLAKNSL